jgi:hypothetical protein
MLNMFPGAFRNGVREAQPEPTAGFAYSAALPIPTINSQ